MKNIFKTAAIALMMVAIAGSTVAKPKVIAHRGYWKCNGSAQNSIAALVNAAQIEVYGSEFDVNVTSDGIAIINHDHILDGKVIDMTPYDEFKDITLSNGETLPTLAQYLTEGAKHKKMKLILEIKPGSNPEKERAAVEAIMKEVQKAGVERQVEYISFSKFVVEELLRIDPKLTVSYLNGEIDPEGLKAMGCPWLDYHMGVLRENADWIERAKRLKIGINVWTVNKGEDMKYFIDRKVDYITTDEPERLQEILEQENARNKNNRPQG